MELRERGERHGHGEGGLDGSWTDTPMSPGPECLLCDSAPTAMATGKLCVCLSLSGHLSSPQAPARWCLCPCLGSRAEGTKAGPGLSPVTPRGARRWGQDDSGLATSHSLTPVYPDVGTAQGQRLPTWSIRRALSPILCLALSSSLPTSIPSLLHFRAVEPLASFTLSGPQFFHL